MRRWILLISLLLFQTACDFSADQERPQSTLLKSSVQAQVQEEVEIPVTEPLVATNLLYEPTPVYRFESTAEALSVWRRAPEKPTLLLLTNKPHLTPVPEGLRSETRTLINQASAESLARAASDRNPAPLILPSMAIDAALRNGWFKELAWALPLRDPALELILGKFTEQLLQTGFADEEEISSIALTEKTFHGSLRDTTFSAAALPHLQVLQQPVIVHIDLSYFEPLYKNEIATPMLDMVFNALAILKKMQLQTLAVTFSYGNLDSQMSLDVRFLGDVIAYLIEDPSRLEQPIPRIWQQQKDALYLTNFMQKGKIRELYLAQEEIAPDKAWIKLNLYRSAVSHKEGRKALDYLAQAVALEPIYALEYFELSNMAYSKKRPDEALRMLGLAAEVFHQDPFLKLQIAQLAAELGQKEKALQLLDEISRLEWSETYFPQMPEYIAGMTSFVQSDAVTDNSTGKAAGELKPVVPGADLSRQRIMHSAKPN